MVSQPSNMSMSPRHQDMCLPKDIDIPHILSVAWAECCPTGQPLVNQLNTQEKTFLILFAEYIVTALDSSLSASDPETVLSDVLMTARHRLSLLSKEVSLSPNFVVIMTLLKLLKNLYSSDNMKYATLDSFMEVYPDFEDRSGSEKEKLFHTANWMHVLFQITTAKKNKGMVMEIIPKFVEGAGVHYVTGSGQTQTTKDRVTVYETEGNVKPIKRQHRKAKVEADLVKESGRQVRKQTKRKATHVKRRGGIGGLVGKKSVVVMEASVRKSHSPSIQKFSTAHQQDAMEEAKESGDNEVAADDDDEGMGVEEEMEMEEGQDQPLSRLDAGSEVGGHGKRRGEDSNQKQYLPLSFAMAPPIPMRRSQSSFSKAAAAITSNQTGEGNEDSNEENNSNSGSRKSGFAPRVECRMSSPASSSYVCSPRECYLDVEPNGTMRKVTSATWGLSSSLSCTSPRSQNPDYQLQMLREVSNDSDFSAEDRPSLMGMGGASAPGMTLTSASAHLLPPYLMHQQSLTLGLPAGGGPACAQEPGSPHPQSRTLERCPTASLDEGEVDFELLEVLSRQTSSCSWLLSRSTSASSLSGRDSVSTVNVNG